MNDSRDYYRMLEIMRLRQRAKWQMVAADWDRLMYKAEQLLSGLHFPRAR